MTDLDDAIILTEQFIDLMELGAPGDTGRGFPPGKVPSPDHRATEARRVLSFLVGYQTGEVGHGGPPPDIGVARRSAEDAWGTDVPRQVAAALGMKGGEFRFGEQTFEEKADMLDAMARWFFTAGGTASTHQVDRMIADLAREGDVAEAAAEAVISAQGLGQPPHPIFADDQRPLHMVVQGYVTEDVVAAMRRFLVARPDRAARAEVPA